MLRYKSASLNVRTTQVLASVALRANIQGSMVARSHPRWGTGIKTRGYNFSRLDLLFIPWLICGCGVSLTCRNQVNQRMMLQSESLAGLQQVMEERSVQLFNQEERIHQRDDLLTKVFSFRNTRGKEMMLKCSPASHDVGKPQQVLGGLRYRGIRNAWQGGSCHSVALTQNFLVRSRFPGNRLTTGRKRK